MLVIHPDEMRSGREIPEGKKLIISEEIIRINKKSVMFKKNFDSEINLQKMLKYQERNNN